MDISSCYVREKKWYSRAELIGMISANDSYAEKIIDELCKTRCLTRIGKASAMKDLSELSVDDLNAAEAKL